MPLITRRSSTRALPLVSVGRCGAIRANCLSVSQKWSRLIGVPPPNPVNHETTRAESRLMGPSPNPKVSPSRSRLGISAEPETNRLKASPGSPFYPEIGLTHIAAELCLVLVRQL